MKGQVVWDRLIKEGLDTEGFEICEYEEKVNKYVDDAWSGTEIYYVIDSNTNLIIRGSYNDSPEQAGGWVEKSVWYNGEWYVLNSISDRFCHIILNGRVLLCELESGFSGEDYICVTYACKESDSEQSKKYFRINLTREEYRDLLESSYSDYYEYCLDRMNTGRYITDYYKDYNIIIGDICNTMSGCSQDDSTYLNE